ncbi:MAG: tetratricopeptide repeat protein [Acidobacteriota bacterium]
MPLDRAKTRANADKLLRANRVQDAIRELQKLAEDNPRDIQTLNQMGNLFLRVGNKAAAVPMFLRVAELYNKSGFATKAVASLKIATREQPDHLEAWEMLASLSEQQGFTREARLAFERVAQLVAQSGNAEATVRIQKKILEIEPENLKVRIQVGDNLIKLGRTDEAVKEYLKAANLFLAQGLAKEAARLYERTLQINPDNIRLLESFVKNLLARHQGDQALQILEQLLERHPTSEGFLLLKAEVLTERPDYPAAEAVCDAILKNHPGSVAARGRLVRLYGLQKRPDAASDLLSEWGRTCEPERLPDVEALYEELLRYLPEHLPTMMGFCDLLRRSGDQPRLLRALDSYVQTAHQAGELGSAREALLELVRLEPDSPAHRERLKIVETKLGRHAPTPREERPAPVPAPAPEQAAAPETVGAQGEVRPGEVGPEKAAPAPEETGELEIEIDMEDLQIPKAEVTASFARPADLPVVVAPSPPAEREPLALEVEESPRVEKGPPKPALDAREAEIIREQLTEAEVFLKYGLTEKAVAELQSVLKKLPDHIHAHQKLIAIYKSKKNTAKAVRQILKLAEVFQEQGDGETCENLVEEARALDPNSEEIQRFLEGVRPRAAEAAGLGALTSQLEEAARPKVTKEKAAPSFFPELDLELLGTVEEPSREQAEVVISLDQPTPPPGQRAPDLILEAELEEPSPVETEAPFLGAPEAEEPILDGNVQPVLEEAIPAEPAQEPPEEEPTGALPSEETTGALLQEEPPAPAVESMAVQISAEELQDRSDLAELLEEAEFYYSQELLGEAQRALEGLRARWPRDPRVLSLADRLGIAAPAEPAESAGASEGLPSEGAISIEAGGMEEVGLDAEPAAPAAPEDTAEPEVAPEPEAEEPIASPEAEEVSLSSEMSKILSAVGAAEEEGRSRPAQEVTTGGRGRTKLKVSLQELLPEEVIAQEKESFAAQGPKKDEYYDLASELSEALEGLEAEEESLFDESSKSPEEMSFEEVFEEFKKGVERKVSEEDSATHYNLGIAYKEMELLDEAIGEFQIAARSPQYFVECCSMLGICFRQKGMVDLAEKWYRKGIEAPGFSDEAYIGLKYDLAETLLEQGRAPEAQDLFREVYAVNAHYRDIKDRVKPIS